MCTTLRSSILLQATLSQCPYDNGEKPGRAMSYVAILGFLVAG